MPTISARHGYDGKYLMIHGLCFRRLLYHDRQRRGDFPVCHRRAGLYLVSRRAGDVIRSDDRRQYAAS